MSASADRSGKGEKVAGEIRLEPGDKAPPSTPGVGENICPECKGSGRIGARACPVCGGTGKVLEGIGGA